jgi:hypothetical protein
MAICLISFSLIVKVRRERAGGQDGLKCQDKQDIKILKIMRRKRISTSRAKCQNLRS